MGNAWGGSAAKCGAQSRVPTTKARARAQNAETQKCTRANADWAYDRQRKACSSGLDAQRPELCAERARKYDRIVTAAAASEQRTA